MAEDILFREKERGRRRFHSRKRSKKGALGFGLAVLCCVVFLVLCIVSAIAAGGAGEEIGIIGMLVMFASAGAFVLSLQGLKEQDVYTGIPFAGLILSGGMFIILFCLYVAGIRF